MMSDKVLRAQCTVLRVFSRELRRPLDYYTLLPTPEPETLSPKPPIQPYTCLSVTFGCFQARPDPQTTKPANPDPTNPNPANPNPANPNPNPNPNPSPNPEAVCAVVRVVPRDGTGPPEPHLFLRRRKAAAGTKSVRRELGRVLNLFNSIRVKSAQLIGS